MATCMPWAVHVPRKDPRRPFNNFSLMAEIEVVINCLAKCWRNDPTCNTEHLRKKYKTFKEICEQLLAGHLSNQAEISGATHYKEYKYYRICLRNMSKQTVTMTVTKTITTKPGGNLISRTILYCLSKTSHFLQKMIRYAKIQKSMVHTQEKSCQ